MKRKEGCALLLVAAAIGFTSTLYVILITTNMVIMKAQPMVNHQVTPDLDSTTTSTTNSQASDKYPNFGPSSIPLQDNLTIPSGSIFFFETSGVPVLGPKQLCAIESTSRHNHGRSVLIGMTSKNLLWTPALHILAQNHANIRFLHVNVTQWVAGTILEPWLARGHLESSKFKNAHTSDILRYAALFKHGGIYVDFDVITLKSLSGLKNAVGLVTDKYTVAANGVMAFQRGHPVLIRSMELVLERFNGSNWASNGQNLISYVLKRWCRERKSQEFLEPKTCQGVQLLPPEAFYPVPYWQWQAFFARDRNFTQVLVELLRQSSFLVHYWNKFSWNESIMAGDDQSLGVLARENCPSVVDSFGGVLWGFSLPS